jgi:hypothetical protein
MADPVSIGMAALKVGSKVAGGIAKNRASKQQKRALYGQAREEEAAGEAQRLRLRDQSRRAIGEQLAGQFANGFLGGTGSALDALTESQVEATLDMLEVRRQAAGKASRLREEGDMRRQEGRFGLAEGLIGGAVEGFGMVKDWAAVNAGSSAPPKQPKAPKAPADDGIIVTRGKSFY